MEIAGTAVIIIAMADSGLSFYWLFSSFGTIIKVAAVKMDFLEGFFKAN